MTTVGEKQPSAPDRKWGSHNCDVQVQRGICKNKFFSQLTSGLDIYFWRWTYNWNILYLCESVWAEVWKVLQMGMTSCLSLSLMSSASRKVSATRSRASSGHGWERHGIKWAETKYTDNLYLQTKTLYLEPVDSTAVDERRKLAQAISEGISDWTEGHNNVKVFFAAIHKEGEESQRTQLQILISSLGNGTYCLGGWETVTVCEFSTRMSTMSSCGSPPLWSLASHPWQKDLAPPLCSERCQRPLEKLHPWFECRLVGTLSSDLSNRHFLAASSQSKQKLCEKTVCVGEN